MLEMVHLLAVPKDSVFIPSLFYWFICPATRLVRGARPFLEKMLWRTFGDKPVWVYNGGGVHSAFRVTFSVGFLST